MSSTFCSPPAPSGRATETTRYDKIRCIRRGGVWWGEAGFGGGEGACLLKARASTRQRDTVRRCHPLAWNYHYDLMLIGYEYPTQRTAIDLLMPFLFPNFPYRPSFLISISILLPFGFFRHNQQSA